MRPRHSSRRRGPPLRSPRISRQKAPRVTRTRLLPRRTRPLRSSPRRPQARKTRRRPPRTATTRRRPPRTATPRQRTNPRAPTRHSPRLTPPPLRPPACTRPRRRIRKSPRSWPTSAHQERIRPRCLPRCQRRKGSGAMGVCGAVRDRNEARTRRARRRAVPGRRQRSQR